MSCVGSSFQRFSREFNVKTSKKKGIDGKGRYDQVRKKNNIL